MTISHYEEQEVQVTAVFFRNNPDKQRLESYPRRMVIDGREVNFVEQGMRYLVQKGQELIRLFDVSDGSMNYRLKLDGANHWTLVDTHIGA